VGRGWGGGGGGTAGAVVPPWWHMVLAVGVIALVGSYLTNLARESLSDLDAEEPPAATTSSSPWYARSLWPRSS
jgi:hypothetical protein